MPGNREYRIGDVKTEMPRRGPGGGMRGLVGGEKAKDFKTAIAQLSEYMRKYIPAVMAAVVLAAAGTILNLLGPGKLSDMTKLITRGLSGGIDVASAVRIAVTLAVLYGLGFIFSVLQGQIMAAVTQSASKGLRRDISKKINRLPLKYFDRSSTGDVLSRVTNDVDTIGQTLNQSLGTLVSAATMFAGSLIMMFCTNWIMAASGVLATMTGFAFMTRIISHSQKYFRIQQNGLGAINGHIEETYAGHTVVKAYNGEKQAKAAFGTMNAKLYDSAWKSQFFSGLMMPLMGFIGNLGYVVVCIVGAVLTMKGMIGFEVIVAFMLYIRLFTQPLTQLAQAVTGLQSAAAASERVFAFLGEPEMPDETDKKAVLYHVHGNVAFDHVRFGYDENKTIIHDFSAEIKAGHKIAVVGPTGAGKTTLVNLLMRFYDVDSGEIRIDGIPIKKLTRENIHALFCMVLQDTWLFEGTIKENIKYSKTEATDEEVIKACEAVGLHHFIKTLPQGYDTVLSDNANLSAGQKQLLTIARAILANAPILILDEATSSVDTRTERIIQKAMANLMENRTSFIIAHRLSTIKDADHILVLDHGDIVEQGSHDELLARGGFYAKLYNSQFAN